jgi:hypothetical protein
MLNSSKKCSTMHFNHAKCPTIKSPTFHVGKVPKSSSNMAIHSRFSPCPQDHVDSVMTKGVRPLLRSHCCPNCSTGQKLSINFKPPYLPHIFTKLDVTNIKTYLQSPRIISRLSATSEEEVIVKKQVSLNSNSNTPTLSNHQSMDGQHQTKLSSKVSCHVSLSF